MGLRLNSDSFPPSRIVSVQLVGRRELLDGVPDLSRNLVRSAQSAVESTLTKSTRVHGTVKVRGAGGAERPDS
jgi:hypothetical protein